MEKFILLEKDINIVLADFKKIIADNKYMYLKKENGNKFQLVSKTNFGNWNMMEKEDYFISLKLEESNGQTLAKCKVRANATFQYLAFIIPFMALTTILIPLKGNKQDILFGVLLYLAIVIPIIGFMIYQNNRLKLRGERDFERLIQMID